MRELLRAPVAPPIEPGPDDCGSGAHVWLSPGLSPETARLKDELAHAVVSPEAAGELRAYLEDCFRRLLTTLSLVPRGKGRILELGANPYYFTMLLRRYRGYEVELANFFTGQGEAVQRLVNGLTGEAHEFKYLDFNIEEGEFPYPDGHFDGVVYCEILEHLVRDPIAVFAEIHRVLKPEGWLLLTTPNVARRQNVMRLKRGQNIYDPYSGYGPYGRHNREYTVGELQELLSNAGFVVDRILTRDLHPCGKRSKVLATVLGKNSGYNLYAVARRGPQFLWYYPGWLFRSGGIRRRVRDPFVRSESTTGPAWRWLVGPERWSDGAMRWTKGSAEAYLLAKGGERRLRLLVSAGPPGRGDAPQLTVRLEGAAEKSPCVLRTVEVPLAQWAPIEIELPEALPAGEVEVILDSQVFVPHATMGTGDLRTLGVGVRCIELLGS
jgi:SAM-dependent methyltransferase